MLLPTYGKEQSLTVNRVNRLFDVEKRIGIYLLQELKSDAFYNRVKVQPRNKEFMDKHQFNFKDVMDAIQMLKIDNMQYLDAAHSSDSIIVLYVFEYGGLNIYFKVAWNGFRQFDVISFHEFT